MTCQLFIFSILDIRHCAQSKYQKSDVSLIIPVKFFLWFKIWKILVHKRMENLLESNTDLTLALAEFDTLQWTIAIETFIEQIMTTSVPKDNWPWIIRMLLPYFSYHILYLIWKVHFLDLYLATDERIIQLKQYIFLHSTSLEHVIQDSSILQKGTNWVPSFLSLTSCCLNQSLNYRNKGRAHQAYASSDVPLFQEKITFMTIPRRINFWFHHFG